MSELQSVYIDRTGDWVRSGNDTGRFYLKSEADKVIAEKDEEIAGLKDKCQMHDFFWEGCGFAKRGFKNTIAVSEAFDKLEAENAELKAKLENVQASAYADSVDAGMRERRLHRALWLARAERAKEMAKGYNAVVEWCSHSRWIEVERKCRAKAEEYK